MEFKHFIIPKVIKVELDKDAKKGKIVVRFPPEPSGCLHIGHVKALYINACIAKKYGGTLIIRMDDTNPLLETDDFENAIIRDLNKLGINTDNVTHSSDYFDVLTNYCDQLLSDNKAYVDLTDVDKMRMMRDTGIKTEFRDASVADNIVRWRDMQTGTLKTGCIRIKISIDHKNKAMRDPTIFRPVDAVHHKTGSKYKVYPTYDFACPIIDAIEGITHVFRSTEFNERDDQYRFILPVLNLSIPKLFHYGKLNILGTELSKRKIKDKVNKGEYDGWNDPRLYTLGGLLRRGLHLDGLEEFMKDTGYPGLGIEVEPVALWTINKKIIDKLSRRYIALSMDTVQYDVIVGDNDVGHDLNSVKSVDLFHRNKELGTKNVCCTSKIFIELTDSKDLKKDEEVTMTSIGNMIVSDNMKLSTNLQGDFKITEKKILWLPKVDNLVKVQVIGYDVSNNKTTTEYIAEPDTIKVNSGEYVQFLKKNYYICVSCDKQTNSMVFMEIP
jgi:glutamyl-tRNA synthetase